MSANRNTNYFSSSLARRREKKTGRKPSPSNYLTYFLFGLLFHKVIPLELTVVAKSLRPSRKFYKKQLFVLFNLSFFIYFLLSSNTCTKNIYKTAISFIQCCVFCIKTTNF